MEEKGSPEAKVRMAKIQLNRKNLTVAARKHLEEKIKDNEALLRAAQNPTYKKEGRIDAAEVKKSIDRDKKVIETRSPERFGSGTEKDKEHRRAQELAESIKVGMPTDSEMKMCPPGMIAKHMNWNKENKGKIAEWKGIMRRLESDNPNAANVERLRRR